MNIVVIIPARYQSTRFPGKPLAMIHGKSMIHRVVEQAKKAKGITQVVVATDDQRIYNHVKQFGYNVILTGTHHPNGTSRCFEVTEILQNTDIKIDAVINVQGDEPTIKPVQIEQLSRLIQQPKVQIATLIKKIDRQETLFNPNVVKVITGLNNRALYFSRQPIPYQRDSDPKHWLNNHTYYKHIGIYAYKIDALKKIMKLSPGKLEASEQLEQLRWIENDLRIYTGETDFENIGIDTQEDLKNLLTNFE